MKTGNTYRTQHVLYPFLLPQWSPVMKTGNTDAVNRKAAEKMLPQWSPVMKTGNTLVLCTVLFMSAFASMEPGHEDREYRPH